MKLFCLALLALVPLSAYATAPAVDVRQEAASTARQDVSALEPLIERFLSLQAAGLPGKINVELGKIDTRVSLAACTSPEAFLPKGNRAWGKITVGVRCTAPTPWSIYVPATVRVIGDYYVAATTLTQGHIVTLEDIQKTNGELTTLPGGAVTDVKQALGRAVSIPLRSGAALRQDGLRSRTVIQQGQTVKVVSSGPGFQISTEAYSLSNASDGQIAQAKTPAGQIVSGVAKTGGILEINY